MIFIRTGLFCHAIDAKVPTRFSDDIPEIEAVADGAHGVFAIDSGNSGSLVIHAKFGNRSGMAEQLSRGLSLTSFGAGGESQNWINYLDRFEISDLFYKMRQPAGTPLKLSVRRGNEVFSKTLVLRELLDRSNDY